MGGFAEIGRGFMGRLKSLVGFSGTTAAPSLPGGFAKVLWFSCWLLVGELKEWDDRSFGGAGGRMPDAVGHREALDK